MVAPVTTTAWQWPPDVLEFAARHQLQPYLEPLRQGTQRVFPTARQIRITLEPDYDIRDGWYILFDIHVPEPDVSNYVEAVHRWDREIFNIVPTPLVWFFTLFLQRMPP